MEKSILSKILTETYDFNKNEHHYINENIQQLFKQSCSDGNIEIAKWIYNISDGKINIHENDNHVFNLMLLNGYIPPIIE